MAREEEVEGEGDEDEEYAFGKDSVLAAIQAVREGKCVVVTDDEGRENEGDLVFAAEKVIASASWFNQSVRILPARFRRYSVTLTRVLRRASCEAGWRA